MLLNNFYFIQQILTQSMFSRISQIIDLDEYESLDAFKQDRKQICNAQKQEYQQMIETRNDGSISPYLDSEVAKVLGLKI